MDFSRDILELDCEKELDRICVFVRDQVRAMKRDGIVIGLSGGIDSAVCSAICVKALGKDKVLGLILPEKESNPISAQYAEKHARELGIRTEFVDITSILQGFGTYDKRDEAIRRIFPEYSSQYRSKITLPSDLLSRDAFNIFTLRIDDGRGNTKSARLSKENLNAIVAATDTKQRTRMMTLYYYAEKNGYLVCGTTNRTETVQGFFVKYGDGGVDIEPIAHLYKVQVYQLSAYLGVIKEIRDRAPSPDTFSYLVTDEEFYFRMPYDKLDLLLYAWENKIAISQICEIMDLEEDQIKRAFRDFAAKYRATRHLRQLPPTLEDTKAKSMVHS